MATADLEIKFDPKFEKANHRAERIGWSIMFALLVATSLGLFGQSRFSWRKVELGNAAAHFSKFIRKEAPTQLRFEIQDAAEQESIWISNEYLKNFRVEEITPEPTEVIAVNNGFQHIFKTKGGKLNVSFELVPEEFGRIEGDVARGLGHHESIKQFAYF